MLIGLFVYLAGRRWLPPEAPRGNAKAQAEEHPPIGRRGLLQVALLVAILPILMLSIVGNQQYHNGFPLWSQKHMDMVVAGFTVPAAVVSIGKNRVDSEAASSTAL